jgi:hypothetical protein
MMNKLTYPEVAKEFHSHFHTSFHPFFMPVYSVATDKIQFDLMKFDDHLHKLHGDYESEGAGKSMRDIVTEKYGADAMQFILKLISQ